jgi:hypothetical protein
MTWIRDQLSGHILYLLIEKNAKMGMGGHFDTCFFFGSPYNKIIST